ncbi:MAG: helix-turn-helix transcriptional regulator [Nocardioides sp.]|nr:helix-turn-helix transcriptional regulator [Nocardioides sp.]
MFFNTAGGAALASHADRALVWAWAERQIRSHPLVAETVLHLSTGPRSARAEPVHDGETLVGALVSLGSKPASPWAGSTDDATEDRWASLTEAERTIAHQVARGLTNRETAALLFLSPHTVDYHLRHIYRKLGVQSRVELARTIRSGS